MGRHPWSAELPRPHAEIMVAAPPYAVWSNKQKKERRKEEARREQGAEYQASSVSVSLSG